MPAEQTRPTTRTVTPKGAHLKKLRVEKMGENVERFADLAGVSEVTISRLENSRPCYLSTLKSVAQALEVEHVELLDEKTLAQMQSPPPPAYSPAGMLEHMEPSPSVDLHIKYCDIELKLNIPFEAFDQCDQLVALINTLSILIHAKYGIGVKAVRRSSTIITLEMSQLDGPRLATAFIDGSLSRFAIVGVETLGKIIPGESGELAEDLAKSKNASFENISVEKTTSASDRAVEHSSVAEIATSENRLINFEAKNVHAPKTRPTNTVSVADVFDRMGLGSAMFIFVTGGSPEEYAGREGFILTQHAILAISRGARLCAFTPTSSEHERIANEWKFGASLPAEMFKKAFVTFREQFISDSRMISKELDRFFQQHVVHIETKVWPLWPPGSYFALFVDLQKNMPPVYRAAYCPPEQVYGPWFLLAEGDLLRDSPIYFLSTQLLRNEQAQLQGQKAEAVADNADVITERIQTIDLLKAILEGDDTFLESVRFYDK